MANFFDNFNNDPVSTEVQTTSYTIPSGQYAKVRVTDFSTDFKIDSVVAIDQYKFSGSASINIVGDLFTNTSSYLLVGSISQSNNSVIEVRRSSILTTSIYSGLDQTLTTSGGLGVSLAPGDTIWCNGATTGSLSWSLSALNVNESKEFWVPEDTLIEGSRFVVELYNKQGA